MQKWLVIKIREFATTKMNSEEKKRLNPSVKTFYSLNHEKHIHIPLKSSRIAKSRDHLIRRIKKCIAKMDQSVITAMFDGLKDKIHKAKNEGLGSLV